MRPVDLYRAAEAVLYPYQRRWWRALCHPDAEAAVLGGRQVGKDYVAALLIAVELLANPDAEWQVVSATRDHAARFLDDVRLHLGRIGPLWGWHGRPAVDNNHRIAMPWGASVTSHASTIRSIVGSRGSFLLNEISALPEGEAILEAAYPIVQGTRLHGRHARFLVVGNASYVGSFWHTAWTDPRRPWVRLRTPWSEAAADLYSPADVARAKRRILRTVSSAAFAQWFECVWRPPTSGLFDPALLDRQRWNDATLPPPTLQRAWPQTLGFDVGRRKHPSALSRALHAPDGHTRLRRTEAWHRLPYDTQIGRLLAAATERPTDALILDATGNDYLGEAVASALLALDPPVRCWPRRFTAETGWEIFEGLRLGLEEGWCWLPPDDLDLRMELDSIGLEERTGLPPRVLLPEGPESHCDRAVAAALSVSGKTGHRATRSARAARTPVLTPDRAAEVQRARARQNRW